MSRCPDCGTEMKPLAYSEFCPFDCDRKEAPVVLGKGCPKFTPPGYLPCSRDPSHSGPCAHSVDVADFTIEEDTPNYFGVPRAPGVQSIDPDDVSWIEDYISKIFPTD